MVQSSIFDYLILPVDQAADIPHVVINEQARTLSRGMQQNQTISLSTLGGSTYFVPSSIYNNRGRLEFTGTPGSAVSVKVPNSIRFVKLTNQTTQDINLDSTGGSSLGVVQVYPGQTIQALVETTSITVYSTNLKYIGFSVSGPLSAAQEALRWVPEIDVNFKSGLPGGTVSVGVNPAASAVFPIKKNGTQFGTLTISTDGSGTFASTGDVSFTALTDVLSIETPSTADGSLASVGVTLPSMSVQT